MAITKIQSESMNLADTYAFTGTVTGAGESNDHSFFAHTPASYQSLSNGVFTKVQCSVELYDTDSAYDHSTNYRFTVPSGQAGKYFFSGGIQMRNDNADLRIIFKINNQNSTGTHLNVSNHSSACKYIGASKVFDLSVGDYVELFAAQGAGSSQDISDNKGTFFCGFKVSS